MDTYSDADIENEREARMFPEDDDEPLLLEDEGFFDWGEEVRAATE